MPKKDGDSLQVVVGQRILEAREGAGLTRRQLAERSGLSHSQVFMIELGRSDPRLGSLQALGSALGLSLKEIVDEGRKPKSPLVGSKLLWGIVRRLQRREEDYLRDADLLLRSLDQMSRRREKRTPRKTR